MSLQGIQLWNSLDQKIQFDQVGIDLTVSIKNVTQCTMSIHLFGLWSHCGGGYFIMYIGMIEIT